MPSWALFLVTIGVSSAVASFAVWAVLDRIVVKAIGNAKADIKDFIREWFKPEWDQLEKNTQDLLMLIGKITSIEISVRQSGEHVSSYIDENTKTMRELAKQIQQTSIDVAQMRGFLQNDWDGSTDRRNRSRRRDDPA